MWASIWAYSILSDTSKDEIGMIGINVWHIPIHGISQLFEKKLMSCCFLLLIFSPCRLIIGFEIWGVILILSSFSLF